MCKTPDAPKPLKAPPPPPAVLQQVAPTDPMGAAERSAKGRRAGTKKYRAKGSGKNVTSGNPKISIGGVGKSGTGVGVNG